MRLDKLNDREENCTNDCLGHFVARLVDIRSDTRSISLNVYLFSEFCSDFLRIMSWNLDLDDSYWFAGCHEFEGELEN